MKTFGCKNLKNKIGVLIAQLGSPAAPTAAALKPYLKQFLGDPRIIEGNRALWWLILNGIILNTRPKRSARLYSRIWTEEGSPLVVITRKVAQALKTELQNTNPDIEVAYGMRYGEPSLESAVKDLIDKDCRRIVLFNMYPQYSATTVATNYDAVFAALLKNRWVPTLKVVEPYYDHPAYQTALQNSIRAGIASLDFKPQQVLLSYHGIPQKYVNKGDPYCCMCTETTAIAKAALPADYNIMQTYQSRFGRDPWLQPYLDQTVENLPAQGIKKIAIACPGFPTDCLETIDEIGTEAREVFMHAGGENFALIPGLNDSPEWIRVIHTLVMEEIAPWLKSSSCRSCTCPWALPVKPEFPV